MKSRLFRALRVLAILLMGLTAGFTFLSGAGTTCVALAAERFGERMAILAPYRVLYLIFVALTLAIGIMGFRAVALLIKGRRNAFRFSVITLVLGVFVGSLHMLASRTLRGSSMPVDPVVYTTVLTLVVFLLVRIPAIWQGVDFEKLRGGGDLPRQAAGITLMAGGLLTLTVQYWAGPTHVLGGVNYADIWHPQLTALGWGLVLPGTSLLAIRNMVVSMPEFSSSLRCRLAGYLMRGER
ncbi:MAG: hypothetical protein A2Y77_05430 [Planctomycetes bacterium RBG_13_62_9]|nr:MAG: hypothetical protein A2Y77_05430 [Planctomycetes bacterium RBG_13_62_9]